ncbi:hypothetical protein OGAPHI_006217 [Ogataea philodendri]|uniref:Uncharacterized protein n=1 Tax=Ogataea philodendri TaxID=1378263 RepID=A0A9P8NZC6_9ASCO|nr:uncharacterized protein OGAPHI_006217 [Ogataea philodendri]KAH3662036.1 hypothetical protein OGAPHI_006217 [Ogataea philodendri]
MTELSPVFSTGRGGAGNIVHQSTADEVIVPQESRNSFKQDENGKFHYPTGRGGAGNVTELEAVPSPRQDPDTINEEIGPVFSTGRGGAGNRVHATTSSTVAQDLDEQVSPVHSNPKQDLKKSGVQTSSKEKTSFFSKLKKLFN